MRNLLTATEVAEALGLTIRTLEDWRYKGEGPPFLKIGHRVRYDAADLERWLAAQRRRSTSDGDTDRP